MSSKEISLRDLKKFLEENFRFINFFFKGNFLNVTVRDEEKIDFKRLEKFFSKESKYVFSLDLSNVDFSKDYKFLEGKTFYLEHTSITPSGRIHIGRYRGSIIGNLIDRSIKYLGLKSHIEYYLNDRGTQLNYIAKKMKEQKLNELEERSLEEIYKKFNRDEMKNFVETPTILALVKRISRFWIENIFKELTRRNIFFDKVLPEEKEMDVFKEYFEIFSKKFKMGKKFYLKIKGEKIYLRKNEKDFKPTYFLKDLIYSVNVKKKRGYDYNYVVVGEDHKKYVENLNYILKEFDFQITPIIYGYVLEKDKKKISTRKTQIKNLEYYEDNFNFKENLNRG